MKPRRKPNGKWELRWREGGRHRARTFDRKEDAESFGARLVRSRQLGEPVLWGEETLSEWSEAWWERHGRHLQPNTQRIYAYLLDTHVDPYLGDYRLRELSLDVLEDWKTARLRRGAGPAAIAKAIKLLRQILKTALATRRIAANPAEHLSGPSAPAHSVEALSPAEVEAIRAHLPQGDAALVSVLAYAGLRPQEALALRWPLREKALPIVAKNVDGVIVASTKTGDKRSVRLLAPLGQDLREWRLAAPPDRSGDGELVFPRKSDGNPWTRANWGVWRDRVFGPAVKAVMGERRRPYDLRHSFASLLIYEGRPVTYVAEQLGHSVLVCARTYAHVMGELEANPRRVKAETAIRAARVERERRSA